MLKTLKNAWKIPDLRKKIMFTMFILFIYRVGAFVPVPGIQSDVIKSLVQRGGGLLEFYDMIAGGAFSNFTIFALGISPYITASIIIQLLTMAIPYFENLAKEGPEGRKKMTQYTRYGTIVLALIQAFAITVGMFNQALISRSFIDVTVVVLTLTAGTAVIMWLGELITEKGIGNGISLIIFAGIITRLPGQFYGTFQLFGAGELNLISLIIFFVITLATIVGIIAINEGQRRIPVQYAKRVVGRKMYGGQSTHIPLKVNQSGVIPIIFAISIMSFPQTIAFFFNENTANSINRVIGSGTWLYMVLSALLIIFFTYFYTAASFNPREVADNIKKNGGFIPGIRPGNPTFDYIQKVMSRITLTGALFLAVIFILPMLVSRFTNVPISLGGTSILIMVGVALETMKQIEAQMLMRHYEGFLK